MGDEFISEGILTDDLVYLLKFAIRSSLLETFRSHLLHGDSSRTQIESQVFFSHIFSVFTIL